MSADRGAIARLGRRWYVYAIGLRVGGDLRGPVKIGVSAAPWGRALTLQCGCPWELSLLHVEPMPDRLVAYNTERQIHEAAAQWRMLGEWFDIEPSHGRDLLREFAYCEVEA